jgi:hypothetical protein
MNVFLTLVGTTGVRGSDHKWHVFQGKQISISVHLPSIYVLGDSNVQQVGGERWFVWFNSGSFSDGWGT